VIRLADDHRWIFVMLLVAALVGWKMLVRRLYRPKE